jgi:hypothetical protein
MISPNLTNSKCLFGELEKYLTNNYMNVSRLLTMGKVEKLWITKFVGFKTHWIKEFLISLKSSWNLNV